jgi:DedD protein
VDRSYNTLHDPTDHELPEREISLGAPTILGIFFALALVCALFFGLGYSMGRRSAPAGAAVVASTDIPTATATTKPSSGSPADNPTTPPLPTATTPAPTTVTVPTPNTPPPTTPAEKPATAPTSAVATIYIVQIAAVSHREDAETLVANLKLRGYDVAIREETQDKLLHVQIGPFTTRKDADAMRQHLLADGYNAIVK